MKMQAVKILWMLSIVIGSSGCSTVAGLYFGKCITPNVVFPDINNTRCKTYECVYDKALTNYEIMKAYGELLYEANQVCK